MSNKIVSTNPAQNYAPVGEVKISTREEVKEKVAKAHKAKKGWRDLGVEGRVEKLKKAVDQFEKDKVKLARLITQEMGKPIKSALGEVDFGLEYFRSYLKHAKEQLKQDLTHQDAHELHEVYHEPYGVAAVIVAWNYPFCNFVWQTGQNLIAGNTVVFKHSEETPLCGKLIEEILVKHLPEGVFNEVYGRGDIGEMLIKENVDLICFTGSSKTGLYINQMASQRLIKTNMELGGSAPGIVFEDADIDQIAQAIYEKRFSNSGQMCDALKRLIVHKSKMQEVVEKLIPLLKRARVGDPEDETTDLGPLVAERQLRLLKEQVADAIEKGAKVLTGGKEPKELKGAYYEPTLMIDIKKGMRVWQEEVFGPVLPIITFSTEEEAIKLANDTPYGLGATIFTRDGERFMRVAREIESGMVCQNDLSYVKTFNPFGGYKDSGNARENAQYGFREVTQGKVISRKKP